MYAIVEISGKQFFTEVGKELKIPHQKNVEANKKIIFDKVFLVVEENNVIIVNQ